MRKQNGFGLLEILITLVLLGVGVAGLVALARNMLSASQEGRRYEVAMRLAESKLDEFRNFNSVANTVSGAVPPFYANIVSGSISNLTPSDAGGSYNLSWDVNNQYLISGAWSTINSAAAPYPDRKVIRVSVNWQNNTNTPHAPLILEGAISPTGSFTQKNLGSLLTPRENPEVDYVKGKVPDVVSVKLGDGNIKETSKPLPHIAGGSSTSRTIQFETATYQTTGTTSNRQAMQDYATVYCSCSTTNGQGKAYLPALPEYIESGQVQYWKVGEQVSKAIGTLQGNSNNQQETLCPSCCREHYDVYPSSQNFSGYYSPLNSNRARYTLNNQGELVNSNDNYVDACRFIRIDGVYRPAPDWHLASMTTFSNTFLNDANNLKNYQDYVAYVVKEHAKWQKNTVFLNKQDDSWPITITTSPPINDFNTWLVANRPSSSSTLLSMSVTTHSQLISRGIYVDIMPPSYLDKKVFNGGTEPDLAKIPFQDVNLTLLSEWSSSDNTKGSVTSDSIDTMVNPDSNKYGTYSRGRLNAKSTTYTGTPPVDAPITITARSYQGNSGIVGSIILPEDNSNAKTSTMQVRILNSNIASFHGIIECLELETAIDINGSVVNRTISCKAAPTGLTVNVNNANVTCQVLGLGNPAKLNYSCSGAPGSNFTLTLSKNGYQITPASQTFSLPGQGTSAVGGCVMMLQESLLTASPAPAPTPTATCTSIP